MSAITHSVFCLFGWGRAGCREWGVTVNCKSYLRFRQIELPGELGAFPANHVLAPLELELQSVQLLCRKGGPRALGPVQIEAFRQYNFPDGAFGVCMEKHNKTQR